MIPGCLTIVALAARLATLDADGVVVEPGLGVETACGLEAGVAVRDGRPAVDVGVKQRVAQAPFWVRAGVEYAVHRETRLVRPVTFYPHPAGVISAQMYSSVPLEPVRLIERQMALRPRFSAGVDVPITRCLSLTIEGEVTNGGRALVAIRKAIQ